MVHEDIERNMQLVHTALYVGSVLGPVLALTIGNATPSGAALVAGTIIVYVSSSGALHWASSLSCALCVVSYSITLSAVSLVNSGA